MKKLPLFCVCIVFLFSCNKKEVTVATPTSTNIKITISHAVDNSDLVIENANYVNAHNDTFNVINFRYFISNIYIHTANDSVLLKETHYVDINTASTLTLTSTQPIKNNSYDFISLIFGLDSLHNLTGYFVNPPEANMAWPVTMGGGYHYMQLEGKFDSMGVEKNYAVHTGAFMKKQKYIYIKLPASALTISGKEITVNISMNINEWFKNPNVFDLNVYENSMMGSPTAQQLIYENGHDIFTVKSIK